VVATRLAAAQAQKQVVEELPDHGDRCAATAGDEHESSLIGELLR
jgi:hypothetical protein